MKGDRKAWHYSQVGCLPTLYNGIMPVLIQCCTDDWGYTNVGLGDTEKKYRFLSIDTFKMMSMPIRVLIERKSIDTKISITKYRTFKQCIKMFSIFSTSLIFHLTGFP